MLNLKDAVKGYLKQRQIEIQAERSRKYQALRDEIDRFYLDLEATRGWVDLPYFKKTSQLLNEKIKTDADIDYYYNRLIEWQKRQTA